MFKKILIANRGEIACRVIKTARKMGIKTVAVYSEADKDALHVEMADEAVFIGPPPTAQSYLVMERIVQACKDTGAEAVHPGYGFLSERPAFCEMLEKEGIVFIGPKVRAIDAMGDKITSKKLAKEAGVSTVPGHTDIIRDTAHALEIAREIGYPVMLKASAGGGGKGMRVAWNDAECADGFERATNEARSSFGDDRVFVEKYIEEPRHIEIQVLGDSHGNILYLGERECSLQRRHQKVIEEAPAPGIPRRMIDRIGDRCVAACKKIGYRGAGTFEFLYENGEFYFIEMNTRVQVEHPVTEWITGVDIVKTQIMVAAGEKLPFTQRQIEIRGHAIECRINAEDPYKFTPSPGRITMWHAPGGPGVRVDSHAYTNYFVPPNYDSMIGKLIVHGDTREQALARMRTALSETVIEGINTNVPLHRELMVDAKFMEGGTNIHYLEEWLSQRQR